MKTVQEYIGDELRKKRQAKGLSRWKLAALLGISQTMIFRYEAGINDPALSTMIRIAKALDFSLDDLVRVANVSYQKGVYSKLNQREGSNGIESLPPGNLGVAFQLPSGHRGNNPAQ